MALFIVGNTSSTNWITNIWTKANLYASEVVGALNHLMFADSF